MLAIQIGTEHLDLPTGTSLEVIEQNPFLQFAEEEVLGNYSLPFDVNAVSPNVRLTEYNAIIQKIVENGGIDAKLYANGLQHSIGKVKIEGGEYNMNNLAAGKLSCYYLFGDSSFYQSIKDKMLRDIDVGGTRTFAWDSYAATGPGFWGHITTVLNAATGYGTSPYDYAFYPVINRGWPGALLDPDLMNHCFWDGTRVVFGSDDTPFNGRNPNRIIPFPYLKYVLIKAAEYIGWTIEGDVLDDADFEKVTMINFRTIAWCYVKKSGGSHSLVPFTPITFNLQDHLPDISITDFFTALKKRFGWWYDFDNRNKKMTVRKLSETAMGEVKDMTQYASPLVKKKISQDQKIYALRNDFVEEVTGGTPPQLQGYVSEVTDLPAAAEALYGQTYLVVSENNYYICDQNEGSEAYEWLFYSYNIFDYEPAGATEEVTTAATTVGMERYDSVLDLIPRIDFEGELVGFPYSATDVEWGIHLCFYHGLKNSKLGVLYPYASSHIYDSNGNQVAEWALTFECKKFDGTEVGLYELNWKALIDILSSPEEMEATLYLPIVDALNLKLSDRIVIAGVMMFIKEKKSELPYNGVVNVETVRII